jgi:tRNA1Val (adenine37-N6)-methyltransferase
MKVGTDAVLLGSWTNVEGANKLLDIGTGSGVIALMLAQRTNQEAIIDAVELQDTDAAQATANVMASPWHKKVTVHHTSIQHYRPPVLYDVIVCNPPYFKNSLRPPGIKRTHARHDTGLTLRDLSASVTRLLSPKGSFSLIMPPNEGDSFAHAAMGNHLYLTRLTRFFSRAGKPQERSLMEFRKQPLPLEEDSLILYESGQAWTEKYQNLTADFYLARHVP